jgi:group I intron endonuclease
MTGIYKITSPSGKVYVGESVNIENRFWKYRTFRCKNQPRLYASLKKYGYEKHIFEIIEECIKDKNILLEREIYWGEKYEVLGENGLNCSIGRGNKKHLTKFQIKLRSENAKKQDFSVQVKRMRETNLGSKRSEESRKKMRDWQKGRKMPEHQRLAMIGKPLPEETKEKIRKFNLGKKLSKETVEKMKISSKDKNKKSIICLNTGEEFSCVNDAAKYFNIGRPSLSLILTGATKKPRHGLLFKYKN